MDKNEFRVLIKHCYLIGKNIVQAQQWLEKCYADCALLKTTIFRWYADFKRGRTDTNDAERSGRPNEALTPENIKQVLKIVMDDRKLKVREIVKMVNISTGSTSTILNEKLDMKNLFSKWVPRFRTMQKKQQRVDDSESCLSLLTRNKQDFLHQYVTMDETWIHHSTPESKRQSAEWRAAGESRPKRPKTQQSAGKVMASAFLDAHGIIYIHYLEKGKIYQQRLLH